MLLLLGTSLGICIKKDDQLKYLLLFGRSSFDYKNFTEGNTNFVPTYQSRNSVDPIYSYNSDDYFGFLDDDEGMWTEELSEASVGICWILR